MTSLGLLGKIALAIHHKRNPTHVPASNRNMLGLTNYYCQTCGYPLYTPAQWTAGTGLPLVRSK